MLQQFVLVLTCIIPVPAQELYEPMELRPATCDYRTRTRRLLYYENIAIAQQKQSFSVAIGLAFPPCPFPFSHYLKRKRNFRAAPIPVPQQFVLVLTCIIPVPVQERYEPMELPPAICDYRASTRRLLY